MQHLDRRSYRGTFYCVEHEDHQRRRREGGPKGGDPRCHKHVLIRLRTSALPLSTTMSTADIDLDSLSSSERTALETYTSVTGQEPAEAIALLRRSQWNVQVSASPALPR